MHLLIGLVIVLVILPIIWIIITRFLENKNVNPEVPLVIFGTILCGLALFFAKDRSELNLLDIIYIFPAGFILHVMEAKVFVPLLESLLGKFRKSGGGDS
jgi:ABC-type glycerol-3-phosphate transport system permease component